MVSGSHFFPYAPLLWVKRMPDRDVMSAKVTVCAPAGNRNKDAANHRVIERQSKPEPSLLRWLCASLVNIPAEERISGLHPCRCRQHPLRIEVWPPAP